MPQRSYWKGYLKLSLVTCPVQMMPATSEGGRIRFRTLNAKTLHPVTSRWVDEGSGKPVDPADQVKGIRVVRQGFHDYSRGTVVEGIDPRGYRYFWFGLNGIEHTPGHATDLEAIQDGFVAVTPLQLDLTHEGSLSELAGRFT